jgi:pimeloyl-ACP methyl ester carboxylesterase
LAYCAEGEGAPVLMVQGAGVHGGGWRPQVDALAHEFRCATFDNRGIGKSTPWEGKLSIGQMADDALAVMDALGWRDAHLVGHSMGGLISLAMALRTGNRVRSLSLLCTFSCGNDATHLTPWMLWTGLRTRIGTKAQRRRAFLNLIIPDEAIGDKGTDKWIEELTPLFGHDLAQQPPIVMKQLQAMQEYDATPRLAELSHLPTLVVSAAHDRIAPVESGRALAVGIPGARYIEIADAGHAAPIQRPDQVNELLIEHLRTAEKRSIA